MSTLVLFDLVRLLMICVRDLCIPPSLFRRHRSISISLPQREERKVLKRFSPRFLLQLMMQPVEQVREREREEKKRAEPVLERDRRGGRKREEEERKREEGGVLLLSIHSSSLLLWFVFVVWQETVTRIHCRRGKKVRERSEKCSQSATHSRQTTSGSSLSFLLSFRRLLRSISFILVLALFFRNSIPLLARKKSERIPTHESTFFSTTSNFRSSKFSLPLSLSLEQLSESGIFWVSLSVRCQESERENFERKSDGKRS